MTARAAEEVGLSLAAVHALRRLYTRFSAAGLLVRVSAAKAAAALEKQQSRPKKKQRTASSTEPLPVRRARIFAHFRAYVDVVAALLKSPSDKARVCAARTLLH